MLDQLSAEDKVAVWQRFERTRNRLPLIDHGLIAAAEAADLAREYCSSTMTQFLVRVLQLSPGEAASRVRAAAAVGPRTTMVGEKLEPQLRGWPPCNVTVWCRAEKVQIVERAMHKLTRPDLGPASIDRPPSNCSPNMPPSRDHRELRRFAQRGQCRRPRRARTRR